MLHRFSYQIGFLYFDNNMERVQNTLGKLLQSDGYRISVWTRKVTVDEDENAIDLYNFIRNQCEHTVLLVTPGCLNETLFLQALRAQIRQKELNRDRSFLVIECGGKLLPEFKMQVSCLDGSVACAAELAMQIEDFFYPQQKEFEDYYHSQNIVIADVIKNSKFF